MKEKQVLFLVRNRNAIVNRAWCPSFLHRVYRRVENKAGYFMLGSCYSIRKYQTVRSFVYFSFSFKHSHFGACVNCLPEIQISEFTSVQEIHRPESVNIRTLLVVETTLAGVQEVRSVVGANLCVLRQFDVIGKEIIAVGSLVDKETIAICTVNIIFQGQYFVSR